MQLLQAGEERAQPEWRSRTHSPCTGPSSAEASPALRTTPLKAFLCFYGWFNPPEAAVPGWEEEELPPLHCTVLDPGSGCSLPLTNTF